MAFKETETLELKTSTSELKEAVISIAAILNKHNKGELYFGVKNDGTVVGQTVSEQTIRDIAKAISDNIEPKVYPKITEEKVGEKSCVLVKFEGSNAPYFAYGRAYIRVGDENKQISAKELESIILKKNKASWEEGFSDKTLEDVNEAAVRKFVENANAAKRIDFRFSDVKSVLNKLNLIKEGRLLKAAEALFCDNNTLEVQAAVFAGKDKLTFLDIKQFKGNIFNLLEQSESYIKEHMNWRAELAGREREEIPEVPVRAITEALVNSLCHRDYANPKGNEVAVFRDRIEIYNPGQFPEEYDPADFIKGEERSILRNPLIANVLYLSKDIERGGSGIRRIYEACKEADVRMEFKRLKSGFLVVFYRKEELGAEKVGEKLTANQEKIIAFIRKEPAISAKELSALVGISQRKIEENISKLKEKRLLRRIGPDKGGWWELVE